MAAAGKLCVTGRKRSKESIIVTIAQKPFEIPAESGTLDRSTDLHLVCLWSALGLVLTALMFIAGFGTQIGQALLAGI